MVGFSVAVSIVITTLLYILPGYIACKTKLVKPEHLSSFSGLLIYICSPCMIFGTLLTLDYSLENIIGMVQFAIATLLFQGLFLAILYLVLRSRYDDARYRLLTIGSVLGNVGFFGLPVIRALMPNSPEVACYSAVFMITMNVYVFTMAVFCLTRDSRYMTLRSAVSNPSSIAFFFGFAFYLCSPYFTLPELLTNAINAVGSMTTPMCMIILGVRLASAKLGPLFRRPFVYVVCLMKLLVFPLFSYALICLVPVSEALRASVLILCGTPCAAIVLSLAEMHDAHQELAANSVLVSTLLCAVTIPLLTLLV